jgi:isoleucyl-tRNA synthetase
VAVTTELDQALIQEGYARELVRRIQQLRKDAGLEISDRIVTYMADSDLMHAVLAHFGAYVREETLRSTSCNCTPPRAIRRRRICRR